MMPHNTAVSRLFELFSIVCTLTLLILGRNDYNILTLFATSTAQGITLEYLFHKLGKYRYSYDKFRLKIPVRGYPPLAVVFGYFWFYYISFLGSKKFIEWYSLTSHFYIISLILVFSFVVELVIDNLLIGMRLWHYTSSKKKIGFIPISVVSIVPAFMTLSIVLSYYALFFFRDVAPIIRIGLLAFIAAVGGIAICSIGIMRFIPKVIRRVLPIIITFVSLNLWYQLSVS